MRVGQAARNINIIASETHLSIQSLVQISVDQASAIQETSSSVHEINMMSELNFKDFENSLIVAEENTEISLNGKKPLKA